MSKKTLDLNHIREVLHSHPFVVPVYLQNYFIQTVISVIIPSVKMPYVKSERKYISLPDGSQLAADCTFQKNKEHSPTLVILSGFEGYRKDKPSRFATAMKVKGYLCGYNVIHLRQRAEGDTIHLTKSLGYVADDLPIAFEQIKKWGITNLFVVGFSAGGYNLLYALGKLGNKSKDTISGIVAISAPLNTVDAWSHIEKNSLFDKYLLQGYKNLIKRRISIDSPDTWDREELKSIKTKRQWADTYLQRWGYPERYSSFAEMNEKTDAAPYMAQIAVPTLIIHSEDDPMTPHDSFRDRRVMNNPYIITLLTKHGGHGGFITFKKHYGDLDAHWAQNRAIEFINLLEEQYHHLA
ncbi:MAG TPA: alpha/beta fold hydrolase [Candidatus Saccharimonadales bacterium]|nr:alpha/beta fold hydrolase [Candidatus Saccharimonadales bacterium]